MYVDLANGKRWLMSMNDWMFLQPDGSLHNYTRVSRWGIHVGTVSTQYIRLDQQSQADNAIGMDQQNGRPKLVANSD